MEQASSSKVTVEYHDPSGVFPLVSRDIGNRLPLRKLNWQSPARPLRQIKSLHVDFVPDAETQASLRPNLNRASSQNAASNDHSTTSNGPDSKRPSTAPSKERRHQIPGLKTSPYLRIYVLRCDDKDTYKSTERKRLRDWIRAHAPPDGKREHHDASEYLILHVVVPDTVAASEPRWRNKNNTNDDADEFRERSRGNNIKWPGKSTRTVFDKLRADFNESGKGTPDRVAQVRLLKKEVPPDLLPTPAVASTLEETPQERENAWSDLVGKLKTLILAPFDARVRQYEEDIAAQEARRSLPGWNFCTFFIHKEGLAKALESVGLVEDALAIYDELALGLETVIRDLAEGNAEGTATSLEETTTDVRERILGSAQSTPNGAGKHAEGEKEETTRLFDKDYRAQIVRSQISVFDFFCYLFSRQKALILRLAGAQLAQHEFGSNFKEGGEDLVLLAEVCWRALSFAHNSGRTLRQDLLHGSQSTSNSKTLTPSDIEALVSSYTSLLVTQVLAETNSALLSLSDESGAPPPKPPSAADKLKREGFGFAMGANPYPSRTSSLGLPVKRPSSGAQSPPPEMEGKVEFEEGTYGPLGILGGREMKVPDKPGIVELAAYRAELIMAQRRVLEGLGKGRGWRCGWGSVGKEASEKGNRGFQDVILDGEEEEQGEADENEEDEEGSEKKDQEDEEEDEERNPDEREEKQQKKAEDSKSSAKPLSDAKQPPKPTDPSTLLTPSLATHLGSKPAFLARFEALSTQAIRHYTTATHMKSAEKVLGDIAVLKFQQADFEIAAKYFEHVLPLYGQAAWGMMEEQAVEAFLVCLGELGKWEEWAKVALGFLKGTVAGMAGGRAGTLPDGGRGLLRRLVELSGNLGKALEIKMGEFFDEIELEKTVELMEDKDGFRYRFRFKHVLDDEVEAEEVSARLVRLDDPQTEFWITSPTPLKLKPGTVSAEMHGAVTTLGAFYVDRILLKAKNLHFTHKLSPEPSITGLGITITDPVETESAKLKRPLLLLYPSDQSFDAQVDLARNVQIEKTRHLRIRLHSGRNVISSLDLRLRPASAGLRLHVADAKPSSIGTRANATPSPGLLSLSSLDKDCAALVDVPYSLEQSTLDIALKLEARYTVSSGESCTFLKSIRLPVQLPLDVDVNDLFQHDSLFSTFTVRSTDARPIAVSSAELVGSKIYEVHAAPVEMLPAVVFGEMPATLVYKITRKMGGKSTKKDAPLTLKVRYRAVQEVVVGQLLRAFEGDLAKSEFRQLHRLLLPLLRERARAKFTTKGLEAAALEGQADAPTYENLGWREVLATLPVQLREGLGKWLREWHDAHRQLEIGLDSPATDDEERNITLAVEVPTLDVVFTTQISLQTIDSAIGRDGPHEDRPVVKLGQPIRAEIKIRHSRIWSAREVFGEGKYCDKRANFIMDVQALPDEWLLGGPKRKHFARSSTSSTSEGDEVEVSFPVVLVPLKTGTLALPGVDVTTASDDEDGTEAARDSEGMSCETVCESAGRSVRVVRDLESARIRVVEGGGET